MIMEYQRESIEQHINKRDINY